MQVNFLNSQLDDYLKSLEASTYTKILKQINLLREYGHNLGMPYSKYITKNLYELRIRGTQEIRIFYTVHKGIIILIHAFIKKTQKTPTKEIETALRRISSLT